MAILLKHHASHSCYAIKRNVEQKRKTLTIWFHVYFETRRPSLGLFLHQELWCFYNSHNLFIAWSENENASFYRLLNHEGQTPKEELERGIHSLPAGTWQGQPFLKLLSTLFNLPGGEGSCFWLEAASASLHASLQMHPHVGMEVLIPP